MGKSYPELRRMLLSCQHADASSRAGEQLKLS
jgi:hypothetical protein